MGLVDPFQSCAGAASSLRFTDLSPAAAPGGLIIPVPLSISFLPRQADSGIGASTSDGIQPGFAGPDADRFLDIRDEDLAIPDAPGLGGAPDRLDRLLDQFVRDH